MRMMSEKEESVDAPPSISVPESPSPHHRHTRSISLRSPLSSPSISVAPSVGASRDSEISSVRPSRASSIVSTRTKVSINTLQEDARSEYARSIDLIIGGQSFRIARDGSRVTSGSVHDSLPPYSPLGSQIITQDDVVSLMSGGDSLEVSSTFGRSRSRATSVASDATETAVEVDLPQPHGDVFATTRSEFPSPIRRYGIGQNSAVLEAFRQQYNNTETPDPGVRDQTESSQLVSAQPQTPQTPNRRPNSTITPRRQGYWLVSMLTSLLGGNRNHLPAQHNEHDRDRDSNRDSIDTMNSDDVPEYIKRLEEDSFSSPLLENNNTRASIDGVITGEVSSDPAGSGGSTTSHLASRLPDTDEGIRNHYINMVRTIDRDYRRRIHQKDRDLDTMRQRLNESDQVFRQQLRARDFTIDDLEQRLTHLDDRTAQMLERARNEVEDLWESRWKDRDHHMQERAKRIEIGLKEATEKAVQDAIKDRDEIWVGKQKEMEMRLKELEGSEPVDPP